MKIAKNPTGANTGAYEKLFKEINSQLEQHQIIVKTGAIVDASVINTPLKPKGKSTHAVAEDGAESVPEVEIKIEYAAMCKFI